MTDIVERGDVYFLYRPKVEEEHPEGLEDIQRFFVVLHPEGRGPLRVLIVGRKRIPEVEGPGQDRFWAFVDRVVGSAEEARAGFDRETYLTGTRGQRLQPEARPAGEGVYAIVRHGDHTHLAYALELPERAGAVQQELNIESEANYIATVKNPETPTPGVGLSPSDARDYPDRLRAHFDGRRFAPADPELLDYEGTELVLISAGEHIQAELGIRLDAEEESAHTADVFGQLGLKQVHHPRQPLFGGEWR